MRVVSGEFKGRNLKTLKGDATRPTTQRVKESLFSSLISLRRTFEGACVLDAFAGSGALGIEALSRGADEAVFFERSKQAAQIVRENLLMIGVEDSRYSLEVGDSFRLAIKQRPSAFDVVFFDPPYATEPTDVVELLETLEQAGSITSDTLVCYELTKKNKANALTAINTLQCELVSSKDFGDTSYLIFRKGD